MLGLFENGFVYSERYRQLSIERGGYGVQSRRRNAMRISWTQFGEVKPESPPTEFLRSLLQREHDSQTYRWFRDTSLFAKISWEVCTCSIRRSLYIRIRDRNRSSCDIRSLGGFLSPWLWPTQDRSLRGPTWAPDYKRFRIRSVL